MTDAPQPPDSHLAPVTPEACRAARALLRWSIRDLATAADMSTQTVSRLENGEPFRDSTAERLRSTFAAHGVEFTNGIGTGARLRHDAPAKASNREG